MGKTSWLPGVAVGLLAGSVVSVAQAPASTSAARPDLSKEASVIESFVTAIRFENDGTQTRDTTVKIRIQSDAGVQAYSVLTSAYASASERLKYVYVRVRQPDGTIVATPESDIQDMTSEVTRQAPEYSDLREKHVAVKGLVPGSVLEYQVHDQVFSPLIPGQFWLAYDFTKTEIVLDEAMRHLQGGAS